MPIAMRLPIRVGRRHATSRGSSTATITQVGSSATGRPGSVPRRRASGAGSPAADVHSAERHSWLHSPTRDIAYVRAGCGAAMTPALPADESRHQTRRGTPGIDLDHRLVVRRDDRRGERAEPLRHPAAQVRGAGSGQRSVGERGRPIPPAARQRQQPGKGSGRRRPAQGRRLQPGRPPESSPPHFVRSDNRLIRPCQAAFAPTFLICRPRTWLSDVELLNIKDDIGPPMNKDTAVRASGLGVN